MSKTAVKNTIGPYLVVCNEVRRIGSARILDWVKNHTEELQIELFGHLLFCHRCSEIHKQNLKSTREEVSKMSHEEQQALMDFDPAVCVQVSEHRDDLIDWLYSIRGTALFYDAQYHLGFCERCPATLEEMTAAIEVPE